MRPVDKSYITDKEEEGKGIPKNQTRFTHAQSFTFLFLQTKGHTKLS